MNTKLPIKVKLIMDWKAAIWAGLISSIVFYLINIFIIPLILGGNMWIIIRLFSSIILGEEILAPPATYDLYALITSIGINFILSVAFTFLIAFVLHKWGLLTGIIGGALFGLAIYAFNFYTLSYFFPWFFALSSWPFVVAHLIFGATAGGIYELLEVEEYVPVTD